MKLVRYNQFDSHVPVTFSGLMDRLLNDSLGASVSQFSPAVDISEDEKCYEIHLAVPGLQKQDFKIDLIDGKLTISGERKMEELRESKIFHSLETQYGSFKRSFFLPEDVIEDQVEALYEAGLLKIKLPKREKKVLKFSISVK
jgi:HSP20 family protein